MRHVAHKEGRWASSSPEDRPGQERRKALSDPVCTRSPLGKTARECGNCDSTFAGD